MDGTSAESEDEMLRTIAKLVAYRKAPAATFVALHPVKTMKLLGSGVVALPVGIWLGRKLAGGGAGRRSR